MSILYHILLDIIFPIFLLIAAGAVLQRVIRLDLSTLSTLTVYFLLPAVCFVNIYESKMSGELISQTLVFLLLFNILLILTSMFIAKANRFDRKLTATFKNSMVLSNSGNYGLPVSELVFAANTAGMSIQIIISIFQNLLTFTYGFFNSVSAESSGLDILRKIIRLPVIYALLLAILLKWLHIDIPEFLWKPIENSSNAFLAVALVTLGAQVAFLKITRISRPIVWIVIGRLIISPIVGLLVIFTLGLTGITAQALFIASSFPSSRNSALLALEYDNYPEYASQAVLLTTVISSITVAVVVYLSKILF
ncbi:AEC family transporter [Bacillus sp. EB106-08-02-XG196]|jgi:malate permease and related proteins|uniref:AEC family transporter n=1 Tax=Bacillus sp. EB106-08-02-XG196 TaxID=2737049 RepID=UPI0015C435E2|nr:AEC family transporter [Bacillus sp. EB106-08-02-XG196]NWQ40501.1 AEC family transporter [Bacillus sp. EB106-08-02-XG196]